MTVHTKKHLEHTVYCYTIMYMMFIYCQTICGVQYARKGALHTSYTYYHLICKFTRGGRYTKLLVYVYGTL